MFSKKQKSTDAMQQSVIRFADVHRDSVSRVKHLKILLDTLSVHEKRQLIDDYSFETFHLVDELLLQTDIAGNPQAAIEAESGLWTLEQVLCLAPELVGNGWQRHSIESLLKKAIYPGNLLAVRKIAIRLFLIFYQELSVFGKATPDLDRVFQCLLPYFPLRSGESTELILQQYCQSAGTVQWNGQSLRQPSSQLEASQQMGAKEKAQMLQVYLDKFLEYCTRESTRIEWNDESKKLECAKFIIDRVIVLYIYETFPDLEVNGVDIFGGWEGAEEAREPLDTSDPVVIARYWLIRWMNNVAGARLNPPSSHPGLLLFHEALFSSRRATNTLLSLQREAMLLPLPCSNVIHKVVCVLCAWVVQQDVAPFVQSGEVTSESATLLLLHTLLSFFHSPYLKQPGDRTQSAISIAFSILRACRDLACRPQLPQQNSARVWTELIVRLCEAATGVCSNADKFSQETSPAFATTILSAMVVIRAVRGVELEDRLWDDIHVVFTKGIWMPTAVQWAKAAKAVTRALILHICHVDTFGAQSADSEKNTSVRTAVSATSRRGPRSENSTSFASLSASRTEASTDETASVATEDSQEDSVFVDTDDITQAVHGWEGDTAVWTCVWKRVMCLVAPDSKATAVVAVETIATTIQSLLSVRLDSLAQWLCVRLLSAPPSVLSLCVSPLAAVLSSNPPPLLQAHILAAFATLLSAAQPAALSHLSLMSPRHLNVLAPHLLSALPKLTAAPSADLIKVLALLSSEHPSAEQLLIRNVEEGELSLPLFLLALNALALLVVQRADVQLLQRVCRVLQRHRLGARLLPVFCSSTTPILQLGLNGALLECLMSAAGLVVDERMRTEMEWNMVSMCLARPHVETAHVLRGILADRQTVLEGCLLTLGGQWPLPGFSAAKWNSQDASLPSNNAPSAAAATANSQEMAFVERRMSLICVNKTANCEMVCRTPVGRHVWTVDEHEEQKRTSDSVTQWLRKEAAKGRRTGRERVGILGAMEDPFETVPPISADIPTAPNQQTWKSIIDNSRRCPQPLHPTPRPSRACPPTRLLEWRAFSASLGFVPAASEVPVNFHRDLKHLDQTGCREVHKMALIYVAPGMTEKNAILTTTTSSKAFSDFCDELGWEVVVGRGHEGYTGGLPNDTPATYYATPETEVIFHVSTKLGGDVTHKVRHLGNDEIHIVWNECRRAYKRETIATKFCDVLIVIENADDDVYRVRVETQDNLDFGPLFDGALVGVSELAALVRTTAINASRAYRLARDEHTRPLRHRETVFKEDTKRHVRQTHLSDAVNSLFAPSLLACQ